MGQDHIIDHIFGNGTHESYIVLFYPSYFPKYDVTMKHRVGYALFQNHGLCSCMVKKVFVHTKQ